MKLITIFTALFILILNQNILAKVSPIESYLNKNSVVILGDTGFDLQSTAYIKNAVQEYINTNSCINIALEISTDQQGVLEKAFKGEEKFSKLGAHIRRLPG